MWTQVLPELNICSDGIMVDLTPPTPGQVWIGNVQGTKFQVSFLVSLISQAQVTGKDIRSQVDSQIILQVRHSGKGWYLTWSNTCPHYDQSLYFIKAKTYLDYIFCRKCWSLKSGFFVLDLWRHVNEQIPVISQTNEKIVFFSSYLDFRITEWRLLKYCFHMLVCVVHIIIHIVLRNGTKSNYALDVS